MLGEVNTFTSQLEEGEPREGNSKKFQTRSLVRFPRLTKVDIC
jgi:hypothetical protein